MLMIRRHRPESIGIGRWDGLLTVSAGVAERRVSAAIISGAVILFNATSVYSLQVVLLDVLNQ